MRYAHENDNELDTWKPLSTVTTTLLRTLRAAQVAPVAADASKLNEKENEQASNEENRRSGLDSKSSDHATAVDRRLRDLAAFERRASGLIPSGRRRN